jgi:predicted O-methyltransferase YrrM
MNLLQQKNIETIVPHDDENEYLGHLDASYIAVSEMSEEERRFLNSLIFRNRPKKLLEVGVSAGASSVIMLNAVNKMGGGGGYSIDKSSNWYADNSKKSGFIVDNYPELKHWWKLFTGGLACDFIEEIGAEIEFCLIDTAHVNPGEIFDFLMILPFLSENALVVFHDTNLHTIRYPYHLMRNHSPKSWPVEFSTYPITNNLLISSIHGEGKIIVNDFIKRVNGEVLFGNIAGIRINNDTRKCVFNVFNLLTIKWQYNISGKERLSIAAFIQKYYGPFYADYLNAIFEYHDLCFEYENKKKEEMRKEADEYEKNISLLSNEIESLKKSNSWRITAPLRFLKRTILRKIKI